jgi:plastocyanin
MRPRRSTVPLAVAAAALVVASCSNTDSVAAKRPHRGSATASPVNGVQQITVEAGNDLRFHPSTLIVHPGKVRVVLDNSAKPGSGPPHNFSLGGLPGAFIPATTAGQQQSVTFVAPSPGTYHFVCTFHETQGQTGTLIVTAG